MSGFPGRGRRLGRSAGTPSPARRRSDWDDQSVDRDIVQAVIRDSLADATPTTPTPAPALSQLRATFLGEQQWADTSRGDNGDVETTVKPGSEVVKLWRMRNTGDVAWPVGTSLTLVGGQQLGAPLAEVVVPPVEPGAFADIRMVFVAPQHSGEYSGFWRLISPAPERVRFGSRVWVHVIVGADVADADAIKKQGGGGDGSGALAAVVSGGDEEDGDGADSSDAEAEAEEAALVTQLLELGDDDWSSVDRQLAQGSTLAQALDALLGL
jgi:hypothetical protein